MAWVTGASSGIGHALALELARRGYDVLITARRRSRLDELASAIEATGRRAAILDADVTDTERMAEGPTLAESELGAPVEVAIANAGTFQHGRVDELTFEQEWGVFEVNVAGVLNTIRPVLSPMRERGSGRVAVVSSIAGLMPLPNRAAYAASKAAVNAWLESLSIELHGSGVTATLVLPGYVDTEMTSDASGSMLLVWSPERAARAIADGVLEGRPEVRFPWQLHLALKAGRALPRGIRGWLLRRQDPRQGSD